MYVKIKKSKIESIFKILSEILNNSEESQDFKEVDYKTIKTYEDACLACPVLDEDKIQETDSFNIKCYKELRHIIRVINGSKFIIDWNDINQKKWYPYFVLSSGFGFSYSHSYYDCTLTSVGSRLCFESEEKANYAGKQFIQLYKEFLT